VTLTGNKPNNTPSLKNISGLVIGGRGPVLQGAGVTGSGGAGFATASGGGGDGGGVTPPPTAPTPLKLFMHVGQLDWSHGGKVVQSAIVNESKFVYLTKANSSFTVSDLSTVTPYSVPLLETMPPDLTTADRYTGLIKFTIPESGNYIMYRHYDELSSKGSNAGGTVLRNEAGHIIRNFGVVPGPSMDAQAAVSSLFNTSYAFGEYRGSKPLLLQYGTYAGMIASPASGQTEAIIQFVNADEQFFVSDTVLAEIDAAASGVDFDPDYGCAFTEALDGDIVTVMKTSTGMTLKKHNPSTVSGSGEQIDASIDIVFAFWMQYADYQLPKFSVITLGNGDYFVVWCNAKDGDGTNGTDNAGVYHCIVSANLSAVVVAPTLTNGDSLVSSWFPCATKLNNGNVAVCWLQYDHPTSNGWPIFIKGAVFSQTGATVVAPVELYDCGTPSNNDPINNHGEGIRISSTKDNGDFSLLFVRHNGYNEIYPSVLTVTPLLAVAGQFSFVLQDLFYAYTVPDRWLRYSDIVVAGNSVFLVTTRESYGATKDVAIYELLPTAVGQSKIYATSITYPTETPERIYATAADGYFRIDLLWSGNTTVTTLFVDPITLDSLPQSESSGQLFYALAGSVYVDARNEWDNTEITIAKISQAQSATAAVAYGTVSTSHVSSGALESTNQNRFYVELDSDSFIFGSGIETDGFPEGYSGSLIRVAIDLVKPFPVKRVFNDVGYIDINADGTYTKPEFITGITLDDGDVIQLREISFAGDLIDHFKVAEATVMLQLENEEAV